MISKKEQPAKSMVWKIFLPHLVITACILVAAAIFISISLRDFYLTNLRREMLRQTEILGRQIKPLMVERDWRAIQDLSASLDESISSRLTIIRADGEVVGETARPPEGMENHLHRPEVRMAQREQTGHAQRYSASLRKTMLYTAVSLEAEGQTIGYIRLARPSVEIKTILNRVYRELAAVGAAAVLLAGLSSLLVSRKISRPLEYIRSGAEKIAEGSLDTRLYAGDNRETASVAKAVNLMADRLQNRLRDEQREKAETMAITASMSEGVIAVDSDERVININPAALRILRLSKKACDGAHFRAVVRVAKLQSMTERALAGEKPTEEEVSLAAGSGNELILQVHATQLRTEENTAPFGALLVLHDITRLRNLEENRKQFVANVSHELRTPITVLRGALETVLDSAMENKEVAERFLNRALNQTLRFERLIQDLLLLSRIEQTEKGSLELFKCRISEVLESARAACRENSENNSSRIKIEAPPELTARLNPGLFEQALINLLNNALSYSPADTEVRVAAGQDERGNVNIKVIDQGIGISPEHISRIFERFHRVDQDRSRKTGGTGLGLAIVKHVMQLHDGRVEAQSTPGEGSVFTLIIPNPAF